MADAVDEIGVVGEVDVKKFLIVLAILFLCVLIAIGLILAYLKVI